MQGKRIQLIYFSMGDSEAKQISMGWKKLIGLGSAAFLFLLLIVFMLLNVFTNAFHNWQVANLSKANSQLKNLLNEMEEKVQNIEQKVAFIEKSDDDLRIFVDLPEINEDIRKLGRGGQAQETYSSYSAITQNGRNEAVEIKKKLDNLSQRMDLAIDSRDEIEKEYNEDLKKLSHTPSIRPIKGGRVSAKFGRRRDPFTNELKPHEGIDITAARGTDVYATADGKVIEVNNSYTPNKSYGKYVTIDHGYGIQTKYAHLSKVLIKQGQPVSRHSIIGKVGSTGRSTGPHLHYEVIEDGEKKDPGYYIVE
ncbi:M23 family metallopeptidase [candidate division KSB1 bacterium]|nr:M23 family metallopeptidase [candidate division KSB1 bacterium]